MKRNYSFRSDKFALFLFGVGAGLFSMVPVSHAQNQLASFAEAAPVIRSPRELMAATNWETQQGTATADASSLAIHSPKMLEPLIVRPEFVKKIEAQQIRIAVQSTQQTGADSIKVDSAMFNLDSKKQTDASFVNEPESQQQPALKFPVNWSPLQPIKQTCKTKAAMPAVVSHSKVTTAELTETTDSQIATQLVTATNEVSETDTPKASLAFLRKPMDLMDPIALAVDNPVSKASRINASTLLQPITTSASVVEAATEKVKQVSLTNVTKYDFNTPLPTGPISLFVDGPDYLSINQVGEYEIAVANSSADTTLASRISLQVPDGAEVLAVQREAEIDESNRTLTWNVDKILSGKQQRIRFRVKMTAAGKVGFPVTISQAGRESQTVSRETIVR